MAKQESLKILAAKSVASSVVTHVNEHLTNAGPLVQNALDGLVKAGLSSSLDYSESSLALLDLVLDILLTNSDGPFAALLLREFRGIAEQDRLGYFVRGSYFYMAEVACRVLGAEWTEKKGFMSSSFGIRMPDGTYYSEDNLQRDDRGKTVVPKVSYLLIKAKAKRIPPEQVDLDKRRS